MEFASNFKSLKQILSVFDRIDETTELIDYVLQNRLTEPDLESHITEFDKENIVDLQDKKIRIEMPFKSSIQIPLMSSSDSEVESESSILALPYSDGEDFFGTFVNHQIDVFMLDLKESFVSIASIDLMTVPDEENRVEYQLRNLIAHRSILQIKFVSNYHLKMSTGDLFNNIERLRNELRGIRYNLVLDIEAMTHGQIKGFYPILKYLLIQYSKLLFDYFCDQVGDVHSSHTDKFLSAIWKFSRNNLEYNPVLSVQQFQNRGFAERKVIFVTELIQKVRRKITQLGLHLPIQKTKRSRQPQTERKIRPSTPNSVYLTPKKVKTPPESRTGTTESTLAFLSTGKSNDIHPFYARNVLSPNQSGKQEAIVNTTDETSLILKQLTKLARQLDSQANTLEQKIEKYADKTDVALGLVSERIKLLKQNTSSYAINSVAVSYFELLEPDSS